MMRSGQETHRPEIFLQTLARAAVVLSAIAPEDEPTELAAEAGILDASCSGLAAGSIVGADSKRLDCSDRVKRAPNEAVDAGWRFRQKYRRLAFAGSRPT